MNTPAALVCYAPQPKAHLCPLDRAVLLVLGNARGFLKRSGLRARRIHRDIYPLSFASKPVQAVVGSLSRLERLGYVQRTAGAWRLAR